MKKLISAGLAVIMLIGTVSAAAAVNNGDNDNSIVLSLASDSHFSLNRDSGYIEKIDGTITVADLKANFVGDVDVKSADGTAKADDAAVATDDAVTFWDDSMKALIYGDVDRTGKVNLTDAAAMMKYIAKWESDISEAAADVDANEKVNLADVSKMLKYVAGWDDISLGNVRMVFENIPLTAENEDSSIDLYFGTPMNKVARSNTEHTGEHSYKMKLAKNEVESCQFFLASDVDKEGMTAELTSFEHEYGEGTLEGEIFREYYYEYQMFNNLIPYDISDNNLTNDYFPEPLLPNVTSFELAADRSQGFMINVTSLDDSPAGMYKATLNIKDADGNVIKTANVYAYVWDFTLPVTPYSASAFGLDSQTIYAAIKLYEGDDMKTYADYYELLLDHNITTSEMPYDILDDRANAYMDDPRVTSFRTMPELGGYAYTDFFGEGDVGAVGQINSKWDPEATAEKLVATMEKVSSNPVWAEKSYFTIMDEPYDEDSFNRIKNVDDWMKGLLGDIDFNLMLCMASNGVYSMSPFIDLVEFVTPYLDIWCPQAHAYTDFYNNRVFGSRQWDSNRLTYINHGHYKDRLAEVMDEGDRAWWYVCVTPEYPYPNYFKSYQGVGSRVLLWQQYMFDVEGLLYWSTNADWNTITLTRHEASDGQLLYWGELYGLEGPVASHRLIQVRDSFDDFDYLTIAEEIAGAEAVDKILSTVTTASLNFTEDPAVLEAARDALAKLILGE